MVEDPAVKTSERSPIVSALLGLPGITQIAKATGLLAAPVSEPQPSGESKVVDPRIARAAELREAARLARIRDTAAFLSQTSESQRTYDGGGSARENAPGAMAPATKASISVIPIGETAGATYTDFILSSLSEQDAEKVEIVETFGAFHLFASGRFARKYQFMGSVRAHPLNHASVSNASAVPASVKLRHLYEQHLRATVQAARQTFTRVTVDRDSYDGWITSFALARDASTEFFTQFTFTMVAYRRTHEKDAGARQLLYNFGGVFGQPKKPMARMAAEVAASVGACEPVWYVNAAKTTTCSTVAKISEDDAGLSALTALRVTLQSQSGEGTAIGGICKLRATVGGKAIELASIGIGSDVVNLSTPQSVFTGNATFRALSDAAAGAETTTLAITATGSSSSGAPNYQTLTIPLAISGKPKTRISGYNIYGGAGGATLLGTVMFKLNAGSRAYEPAMLDTISIPTARSSLGGVPTAFNLSAEPICVDAKTGKSAAVPAGLQLALAIYTGETNKLAERRGPLTNSRAGVEHTYATDLEAVDGAREFQKFGATAVTLQVTVPPQPDLEATPTAECRFKLSTVWLPFAGASPLLSCGDDGNPRVVVVLLVRDGLDLAAAVALAKQFTFTAGLSGSNVRITVSPGGGSYYGSDGVGVPLSSPSVAPVRAQLPGNSGERLWLVLTAKATGAVSTNAADEGFSAVGPPGLPVPPVVPTSFFAGPLSLTDPFVRGKPLVAYMVLPT